MKIEKLGTGSLKFYKYNNKTHPIHQVEKIARSIEEFGFHNPVLIDGNDVIIAGHGRVLAAKKIGLHPTMKPIELCAKAIGNSSKPNESVIDLFGGSGSTMVACEQLNRKCYMMELDPKYCQVIINRIIKLNPKVSIQCLNRNFNPLDQTLQGGV